MPTLLSVIVPSVPVKNFVYPTATSCWDHNPDCMHEEKEKKGKAADELKQLCTENSSSPAERWILAQNVWMCMCERVQYVWSSALLYLLYLQQEESSLHWTAGSMALLLKWHRLYSACRQYEVGAKARTPLLRTSCNGTEAEKDTHEWKICCCA